MSKFTLGATLIGSTLLLAGCIPGLTQKTQTPQEALSETAEFAKAIQSGQPTYCTIANADGTIEYWIKGKMFRMMALTKVTDEETNEVSEHMGYAVSDNQYIYSWSNQSQQGVKIRIPTEEEMKEMSEDAKQYEDNKPKLESEEDFAALQSQGYTVSCKPENIPDEDFTPPSDVKFIDPSEMMKTTMPEGSGMGEIDIQKLQEQYGIQQ